MMMTPASGAAASAPLRPWMRSADQPEVPTSTFRPCCTANSTTSALTSGRVTSTTRSAASISSRDEDEFMDATSSRPGSCSTMRAMSEPILPFAPTTATFDAMGQIYQGPPDVDPGSLAGGLPVFREAGVAHDDALAPPTEYFPAPAESFPAGPEAVRTVFPSPDDFVPPRGVFLIVEGEDLAGDAA